MAAGPFQVGEKLPFDKLRANGQAFPFALSLSKGEFAPNLKIRTCDRADCPIHDDQVKWDVTPQQNRWR
jgi:hypothetical protein